MGTLAVVEFYDIIGIPVDFFFLSFLNCYYKAEAPDLSTLCLYDLEL